MRACSCSVLTVLCCCVCDLLLCLLHEFEHRFRLHIDGEHNLLDSDFDCRLDLVLDDGQIRKGDQRLRDREGQRTETGAIAAD